MISRARLALVSGLDLLEFLLATILVGSPALDHHQVRAQPNCWSSEGLQWGKRVCVPVVPHPESL